jgi:hypothetical protein
MEERLSEGLKRDLEKLERDAKRIDRTEKRLGKQIPKMERNRFAHRAIRCQDEYNVEHAAAQLDVDKEKCRLLKTFRDECLIPRFKDDFDDGLGYLEDLNQFEGEIREIGEIFETLGLAKPRRGVSWVPRQKLRDIIDGRLSRNGEKFNIETAKGVHEFNLAKIRAYLEVAEVAAFIVTVMSAVGVKTRRDGRWKANPALRELLMSGSVKGRFTAAAATTFLGPKPARMGKTYAGAVVNARFRDPNTPNRKCKVSRSDKHV